MQIINKTKDLFKEKTEKFFGNNGFYSYVKTYKSMVFSIYTELDTDNRTKILQANVRWCYSTADTVTKEFEHSPSGFEQACAWIDETRLIFIKQLL